MEYPLRFDVGQAPDMPLGANPPQFDVKGASSPHRDARPTVLVVDDEAEIVELIVAILEDEGYRVLHAYDGQTAYDLALVWHPDLVISDVTMPRMGGLQLVDRLRAAGNGLAGTRVILMSAVTIRLAGDGVTFLSKPFDLEHMLSMVSAELTAD